MNLLHLIFFGPCPIFFWSRIETKQNKMFTFVFGEEPSISGSKLIVCCFLGCSLWRLSPKRERLIQLIHLRPSSPPLFICPFSAFSPYIHPSNPPPFSQPLSLAPLFYWPPVFLFPTATRRREDQPTPPNPLLLVPQVNQRRPRHTLARKDPGSPYGLAEKCSF